CSRACPKGVDPAAAIQQYKLTATTEWFKSLLMPWRGGGRMSACSGRLPRPYLCRPSAWWWLGRWTYLTFMLRDFSCVFMAYFVVVTLLQIRALGNGPEAYAAFEAHLRNPLLIVLNAISLLFVVYHAVTFFNAAST